MSSYGRINQPGGHPDFPWNNFPRVLATKVLAQWNGRLALLKERRVHVSTEINWNWIEEVGLLEAIEPYLIQSYDGIQGWFVCTTWRTLFHIQDPVYNKLVVEHSFENQPFSA
ncbi:unnamed protein product [Lactuca saligna]|uniref:Uncharacterized protein n=1 Tax=Lactuca saligna TaxID=75948 RepID=A0AA36A2Y2_LACSI|nr:unnamed protein product [Lactuca saligna]